MKPSSTHPLQSSACLLVAALLLGLAPASAQQDSEAPARDFAAGYLAQKEVELQRSEQNLRASGRLQARDGLLAVLRAQNPLRKERLVGEGAQKDRVETALLQTLADYLASVGFLPNDLQTLRPTGVNLIQAGHNVLFGIPFSADEVAVSEAVVLARVDRRADDATADDGFGSTVFVTVEKSYKGPFSAGQALRLRQLSGDTVTLEGEIGHAVGQRYLLFVSPTLYQTRTGARDSNGLVLGQVAPYLVKNGVLHLTVAGQTGHGKSLSAFESEIAAALPRK